VSRIVTVGAAQLGPIQRHHTRAQVVERLVEQLHQAKRLGCDLVVFPELALTTFFPRWYFPDENELHTFFETEMPSPATRPLFQAAAQLGVGFYLGYAELTRDAEGRARRFNASILVDTAGHIVGKYHKVHLPGHRQYEPWRRFQHLEKRYFEPGDRFPVWRAFGGVVGMALCNDRRWPETYRLLGLGGAELILIGYNTPVHNPPAPEHDPLSWFHNHLVMQAGAYQNGCWVVGVAKAGLEEETELIGGSAIIGPSGEIASQCLTSDDELAVARCDLDLCLSYKNTVFNFEAHRQVMVYGPIAQQRGATPPG
jgi:predicted amidohydrolase